MPLVLLGALWVAQVSPSVPEGVPLRVLTFNIRYDEPADGLDAWPLRRDDVAGLVRFHRPDVAGLQEVLAQQLDELLERLPDYEAFGAGRDGGRSGEHCPVFYRRDRLELLRQETFWLSDTPDRPGAAWGARLNRICTWGWFRVRDSGETFSVWNVHLDHQSQEAREKSAELMAMLIGELPSGEPAVLLGDFNCGEPSQAYARLVEYEPPHAGPLVDSVYAAREPGYGPSGTFTGFGRGELGGQRIDHVLVRGPLHVERHAVLSDTRDGRTPSDHRPVLVDLTLGVPFFLQPRIELRSGWRFQLDPQGDAKGLAERSVNDSTWPALLTGEPWERQGHPDYDGVAWYRRLVTVPRAWRDESVHVTWGGAANALTLWVNQEEVLRLDGPDAIRAAAVRLPAGLLRSGGGNLLVFRVEDQGGAGGLVGAPVALEVGRATSTHWARRFQARTLLDDVAWTAGGEAQDVRFEFETGEGDDRYLDVLVRPAGTSGPLEAWLVAPDGRLAPAIRERSGELRLELRADPPGSWKAVVADRRGAGAAGRLRIVLWEE